MSVAAFMLAVVDLFLKLIHVMVYLKVSIFSIQLPFLTYRVLVYVIITFLMVMFVGLP